MRVEANLPLVCFSRRIAPFFFYVCSGGVAPAWDLHPAPPVSPLTRSRRPGYPLTTLLPRHAVVQEVPSSPVLPHPGFEGHPHLRLPAQAIVSEKEGFAIDTEHRACGSTEGAMGGSGVNLCQRELGGWRGNVLWLRELRPGGFLLVLLGLGPGLGLRARGGGLPFLLQKIPPTSSWRR